MYAHMQACGLVNDHLVSCDRWAAVQASSPGGRARSGSRPARPRTGRP
jgi:hypothetical protein